MVGLLGVPRPNNLNALLEAMFATHGVSRVSYRLYESLAYLAPYAAFAESPDFDALRLWAVDHNDWKGIRTAAVIVSDEGHFWYVSRSGKEREGSHARGRTGGESQVERLTARLEGRGNDEDLARRGYELPSPERWRHSTIQVPARAQVTSGAKAHS